MLQTIYLSALSSRAKTPGAEQERMAGFDHVEEASLPMGAGW